MRFALLLSLTLAMSWASVSWAAPPEPVLKGRPSYAKSRYDRYMKNMQSVPRTESVPSTEGTQGTYRRYSLTPTDAFPSGSDVRRTENRWRVLWWRLCR
jgi:hypothetical protein